MDNEIGFKAENLNITGLTRFSPRNPKLYSPKTFLKMQLGFHLENNILLSRVKGKIFSWVGLTVCKFGDCCSLCLIITWCPQGSVLAIYCINMLQK